MSERTYHRTDIYIADIRALADAELFEELLPAVPSQRREQIMQYRKPKDRMQGLGAGLLLEYGLRVRGYTLLEQQADYCKVTLEKGRYGKPHVKERADICFNLSHAGDYVAAVFAEQAVGIDIEQVREVRPAFIQRFFTTEECAYLERVKAQEEAELTSVNLAFTKMWTRKESYIKAVGEGMHLPLTDFCVLADQIEREDMYYWHTWEKPDGYGLSVCGKMPVDAEPIVLDVQKIL